MLAAEISEICDALVAAGIDPSAIPESDRPAVISVARDLINGESMFDLSREAVTVARKYGLML